MCGSTSQIFYFSSPFLGSHAWNYRDTFSQIKKHFVGVSVYMLKNLLSVILLSRPLVSCEISVSSLGVPEVKDNIYKSICDYEK